MSSQRSPFPKLLLPLVLLVAGCVGHNVFSPVALRDAATQDAAGHYSVIYEFKGCPDGAYPAARLVVLHGLLYGTTQYGGAPGTCGNFGNGTVFSISPSGHENVLYRFTGSPDGALPSGSLADLDGKLYGVTSYGGTYNGGAVFEVTPSGKERVLYSFQGGSDGSSPAGSLGVKNGRLFGTTMLGGGNGCHGAGCGVLFSLSPSGSLKIVYRFRGGRDGFAPTGLSNIDGSFYGATPNGGSLCRVGDYTSTCGTIFKVDSDGHKTTLYMFKGRADGANPNGDLMGKDGVIYGTAVHGGALDGLCTEYGYGCGVVLSLANEKSTCSTASRLRRTERGPTPASSVTEQDSWERRAAEADAPICGLGVECYSRSPLPAPNACFTTSRALQAATAARQGR